MKIFLLILLILAIAGVLAIVLINLRVASYSSGRIYRVIDEVPAGSGVAIVLGARVTPEGEPSNTIYDRTLVGAELYRAGKVSKVLLSGGGLEPEGMKRLALGFGVPANDIIIDELGLRTYESCLRAKNNFNITEAVIVTQDYHLPRSLYLCQNLQVNAIAINAKRRDYNGERYAHAREYLSNVKAWKDINLNTPSANADE
ncbi:MAG TPA: ElyC/SanA/YdcF family protein [Pyrinomonadaceae bacterium]|nr:ElyC/SanA/YdcF family protein [Pyrinomonadaceae bacterium]